MANTAYATVADVRAEGLTDTTTYPDPQVQASLNLWAQFIERATGQFFDVRSLTLLLDGKDTDTLFLPFPIIAITQLFMNNRFTASDVIDPIRYVVYNRTFPQDDRRNPKIKLVTANLDFYQMAAWGVGGRGFLRGLLNQKLVGTFGFVESDNSTPLMIKRALMKLVLRNIDQMAAGSVPLVGGQKGHVTSETTDSHSVMYQAPKKLDPLTLITGDPEVDKILRLYRAPINIAVTGSGFYSGQFGG